MLLCSGRPKQTAAWHERSDSFAPRGAHHPLHGASGSHCNNGKLLPFYITQYITLFTSRSSFSLRHNSEEALKAFSEIFVIFALTCFKNTCVFNVSLRSVMIENTCHPSKLSQYAGIQKRRLLCTKKAWSCSEFSWAPRQSWRKQHRAPRQSCRKQHRAPQRSCARGFWFQRQQSTGQVAVC